MKEDHRTISQEGPERSVRFAKPDILWAGEVQRAVCGLRSLTKALGRSWEKLVLSRLWTEGKKVSQGRKSMGTPTHTDDFGSSRPQKKPQWEG